MIHGVVDHQAMQHQVLPQARVHLVLNLPDLKATTQGTIRLRGDQTHRARHKVSREPYQDQACQGDQSAAQVDLHPRKAHVHLKQGQEQQEEEEEAEEDHNGEGCLRIGMVSIGIGIACPSENSLRRRTMR